MDKYLVVLAGAGFGGVARYAVSQWVQAWVGARFPLGTFVVNLSGSFLIGFLMTVLIERAQPHPYWRLFVVVGVLGGYTTFSSFEYETLEAMRDGAYWMSLLYVGGSVVMGYVAVWLGAVLASRG